MTRTTTITLFYLGIAVLCAAILGAAFFIRSRLPKPELPPVLNIGKQQSTDWFPISRDLEATNQEGERVKLSDLKGKVWVAAQFFAVCPQCAVRNGERLHKLYDTFSKDPDFHIVCITVDPENDDQERLAAYAKALGADTKNWWFLNAGDVASTHAYLEKELKFLGVRERTDPADIEANGRFAHDLGFLLVNRDLKVIGKWPGADERTDEMRALDPGLYDRLQAELFQRVRQELDASPASE